MSDATVLTEPKRYCLDFTSGGICRGMEEHPQGAYMLHAHYELLRAQRDALAAALRDMFAMMEEGLLIRDISKDGDYGDSDWGMRMLQYTRRLAAANSALAAVPERRRRRSQRNETTASIGARLYASAQPVYRREKGPLSWSSEWVLPEAGYMRVGEVKGGR